jgi:hypothetical protein
VGKLSSPDEASEALHVCTMAMEVVVVLFNHQICLNPLAPRELQQLEDMPPVAEVGKPVCELDRAVLLGLSEHVVCCCSDPFSCCLAAAV